jgi:hypothetical protein
MKEQRPAGRERGGRPPISLRPLHQLNRWTGYKEHLQGFCHDNGRDREDDEEGSQVGGDGEKVDDPHPHDGLSANDTRHTHENREGRGAVPRLFKACGYPIDCRTRIWDESYTNLQARCHALCTRCGSRIEDVEGRAVRALLP